MKLDRVARQEIIKDSSSDKLGPLEGALSDNYPSAGDNEFTKFISTYFCSFLWFLAKNQNYHFRWKMSNKTKVPVTAAARLKNDYLRLKKEPIPLVYAEVRTFKNPMWKSDQMTTWKDPNGLYLKIPYHYF